MNEKYSWAAVLSAIWPGLGQLYQKKKWAPWVMLGYGALGFWFVTAFSRYQIEKLESSYPDASFIFPLILMAIVWLSCIYGPIAGQSNTETNNAAQGQAPKQGF